SDDREIAAYASRLRCMLGLATSNSAGTFQLLRSIDAQGRQGQSVAHSEVVAIREALSAEDTVSVLVEFPLPARESLALVRELGSHLLPIADGRCCARKWAAIGSISRKGRWWKI